MLRKTLRRDVTRCLAGAAILLSSSCFTSTAKEGDKPDTAKVSVKEAMADAKRTGKPVLILGISEGCSRCQALKQGLSSQTELKLLLTQYVTVEVPFAGREFKEIFNAIVARDKKFNQAIGAPSVFLLTAAGETVYAGPNHSGGMAAGEELKKLLVEGIGRNGGVRASVERAAPSAERVTDLRQARKLLADKQAVRAALLVAKYIPAETDTDEQVAELVKLTGLSRAKSKEEAELDGLTEQLSQAGQSLIEAAVTRTGSGDATRGAVQLAELNRAFGKFPSLAEPLAMAWKKMEVKSSVPNLREQAELIDKARAAENEKDLPRSIAAYEEVVATYPGTQAAELSQVRINQLRSVIPKRPD
jgi:thioredoxin-related protein